LLFLDFDGTLHPNWTFTTNARGRPVAQPYAGPCLVEAERLTMMLAPYAEHLQIVLSSWWAYTRPLGEVRALLPDLLASRVIDGVWLPHWMDRYRAESISRYACIQLWREHRQHIGPWLALDDDDRDWPAAQRHHLVHADGTLASPLVQDMLRAMLAELLPAP